MARQMALLERFGEGCPLYTPRKVSPLGGNAEATKPTLHARSRYLARAVSLRGGHKDGRAALEREGGPRRAVRLLWRKSKQLREPDGGGSRQTQAIVAPRFAVIRMSGTHDRRLRPSTTLALASRFSCL